MSFFTNKNYSSPRQYQPGSPAPKNQPPSDNTMIKRIKKSIQMFIPASIREQVNGFFDLLDITLQIDKQNEDSNYSSTIDQIKSLLTDISDYIKHKINEMQLTGLAQNFFESLAAWIVLFAYLFGAGGAFNRRGNVVYHGDGGKFKRSNKRRKHKKTNKHR